MLQGANKTTIYWGGVKLFKGYEIVPNSAPGRNSRNEKYIQTLVTGRNLPHLTEFVTRRLQEGAEILPEAASPPSLFIGSTCKCPVEIVCEDLRLLVQREYNLP
jgi:hypothetical protein